MSPSDDRPEVTLAPPARDEDVRFAARFGVALAPARDPSAWQILAGHEGFRLAAPGERIVLALDAARGPLRTRLATAAKKQPLARAFGLHRRSEPLRVVDATAGLCRDAMVLAKLGCTVTAIERVPALALLAADAVRRAPSSAGLADRLTIAGGDAAAQLRALAELPEAERPDAVYLDPMFTATGSAAPKKEMQVCRALAAAAGDAAAAAALFAAARAAARERVVVKRHPGAAPLAPDPTLAVAGERVRFDVYLLAPRSASDVNAPERST